MDKMEITFRGDLERLSLKPGDVLVLSSPDQLSQVNRAHLQAIMVAKFPGHDCLVLSDGLRLGVTEGESDGQNHESTGA